MSTEKPSESVWDYPRPPRLEKMQERVQIVFADSTVADANEVYRVLETSHPPTYYIAPGDVDETLLELSAGGARSLCEFKGQARYFDLVVGTRRSAAAAWQYQRPQPAFAALKDYYAFYPGRVDACYIDGEPVRAQDGDFYGGWITRRVTGPFKGAPGTRGW